jgi:hypothetical protein
VTIAERIKTDVSAAMKAGEKDRVGALRLVLSELQKAEKEGGGDEQEILRRERKRRRDAEQAFRDAGRDELAAKEAFEATLIEDYLPAQLSDDELDALVRDAIEQTGAASPREMGKAIGHVKAAAGGRADGARIAAKLAGQDQRQQVRLVPADDEHRAVLAPAVVLLERHPGPDDLTGIRDPVVRMRRVLHPHDALEVPRVLRSLDHVIRHATGA